MTSQDVRSFDREIEDILKTVAEMGHRATAQLAEALTGLEQRDGTALDRITETDVGINALERVIDEQAVQALALRQPETRDLRLIVASLRTAIDLERVGDYAKNMGKHHLTLSKLVATGNEDNVLEMGHQVVTLLADAVAAFVAQDLRAARVIRQRDVEIDKIYTRIFGTLLGRLAVAGIDASACTHLLFVTRALERIGDHATNVADNVLYTLEGVIPDDDRGKADASPFLKA